MNHSLLKLSWFCAPLVLLSACGTGSYDSPQAGIEGSGIEDSGQRITTSGVITALGSIVVNGVRYELEDAPITINGSPASEDALAPGHVTIVEAELNADGGRGIATRVTAEVAVAGPVSAVDTALERLTILGQTIAINAGTIIEGRIEDDSLGGLAVGQDMEVSGFADSAGVMHATRIESRRAATPLLLTGYVSDVDRSARTFSVNGQVVSYTTAMLRGFESPADGAPVRVAAQAIDQGTLVADEVVLRTTSLPGALGDAAALQGWITRFESVRTFDVDGRPIVATDATRIEGPTDGTDLTLDAFVSVTGALDANGVIQASRISAAVAPGRLVGQVVVDNNSYGISGVMTPEGRFRLNIEELSPGPPATDSGLGQLVGRFSVTGPESAGVGVLIGEGCALSSSRFCGAATAVRLELTQAGGLFDSSGVIRVATESGEEIWPWSHGYWGGRSGFEGNLGNLQGLFEIHQAEFSPSGSVIMRVDGEGRLFFESAETGCTGNGVIEGYRGDELNLYNANLKIEGCANSFAYLNADFEGLATLESWTPWDYDYSILTMWFSTAPGIAPPAAISLWARAVDSLAGKL